MFGDLGKTHRLPETTSFLAETVTRLLDRAIWVKMLRSLPISRQT
jgi:hypothetical protein